MPRHKACGSLPCWTPPLQKLFWTGRSFQTVSKAHKRAAELWPFHSRSFHPDHPAHPPWHPVDTAYSTHACSPLLSTSPSSRLSTLCPAARTPCTAFGRGSRKSRERRDPGGGTGGVWRGDPGRGIPVGMGGNPVRGRGTSQWGDPSGDGKEPSGGTGEILAGMGGSPRRGRGRSQQGDPGGDGKEPSGATGEIPVRGSR